MLTFTGLYRQPGKANITQVVTGRISLSQLRLNLSPFASQTEGDTDNWKIKWFYFYYSRKGLLTYEVVHV